MICPSIVISQSNGKIKTIHALIQKALKIYRIGNIDTAYYIFSSIEHNDAHNLLKHI